MAELKKTKDVLFKTKDSLLKTEDVLLKTKGSLLKTEDNRKQDVNICLQCTQNKNNKNNRNNYKRVISIVQLCLSAVLKTGSFLGMLITLLLSSYIVTLAYDNHRDLQ